MTADDGSGTTEHVNPFNSVVTALRGSLSMLPMLRVAMMTKMGWQVNEEVNRDKTARLTK